MRPPKYLLQPRNRARLNRFLLGQCVYCETPRVTHRLCEAHRLRQLSFLDHRRGKPKTRDHRCTICGKTRSRQDGHLHNGQAYAGDPRNPIEQTFARRPRRRVADVPQRRFAEPHNTAKEVLTHPFRLDPMLLVFAISLLVFLTIVVTLSASAPEPQ
jgi:hypothetical protein